MSSKGRRVVIYLQLLLMLGNASSEHDKCRSTSSGGTPASSLRTCQVNPINGDHRSCLENSNSSFYHQYSDGCNNAICLPADCLGFVGMNLTYECSFDGARLYRYKNGEFQYLNGPSVNYDLLLPEHGGLYQCRNSEDLVVYTQNITVNEEVRIGSSGYDCSRFFMNRDKMCCESSNFWSITHPDTAYQFVVYANPTDVSVNVEQTGWEVERETRNDVDTGIYVERDKTNPVLWMVKLKYLPLIVTDATPTINFRITANNTNFSNSVCHQVEISDSGLVTYPVKVENTTLPTNITIPQGEEAVFKCSFSILKNSYEFSVMLSYSKATRIGNMTVYKNCSTEIGIQDLLPKADNCSLPEFEQIKIYKDTVHTNEIASVVEFKLQIPNVTSDENGSSFTCSLLYQFESDQGDPVTLLQWKKMASLTVSPEHIKFTDPMIQPQQSIVAPLVAVAVILLTVIIIALGVTIAIKRKKKSHILHSDEVPLTNNMLGSEPSTPVDLTNVRFPSIQISSINSASLTNTGSLVGDYAPQMTTVCKFDYESSVTLVNRTIELYDLSEFTEFVVYISYTDQTSEWVRNELKPLIESWHSAIRVDIHEDSMIPGFSVPDERYRLILGADKIIIVVSSDYASSEWCVYELEHAIHQKPALCNGRVIPILTETNNCLPRIINGVVCMCLEQDDFQPKLRKAILKKPKSIGS